MRSLDLKIDNLDNVRSQLALVKGMVHNFLRVQSIQCIHLFAWSLLIASISYEAQRHYNYFIIDQQGPFISSEYHSFLLEVRGH